MARNHDKILDALAWLGFAIVVLYLLLKVLGFLESPLIADIAAVASAAFFVGRYAQKIDTIDKQLAGVSKRLGLVEKEFLEFRVKAK